MNGNGILHLSVNGDGRLSLWDTPGAAVEGKEKDEVVVTLTLNAYQYRNVQRAVLLAQEKRKEQKG